MKFARLASYMNNKRAFEKKDSHQPRPAIKRSFIIGYGRGSQKRNVISMSKEDLGNLMKELKLGLYHIGEALRLAEIATTDLLSIEPIKKAQYLIQRFVRTTAITPKHSHQQGKQISRQSTSGWNPMRSQFLGLPEFQRRGCRGTGRGRGNGRGYGRGRRSSFFQRSFVSNKPRKKPVNIKCNLCDVKCNSASQWEQHLKGHHHKARVAGEDTPKRTKRIDLGRKVKDQQEKFLRKTNKPCPTGEEKQHTEGRKPNKKTANVERRNSNEKRQSGTYLRCELCDTTCNGKVQYEGHMNGKQHQMALERREKDVKPKTVEKLMTKEAGAKHVTTKTREDDLTIQTENKLNI